jgi:hypothetical protein
MNPDKTEISEQHQKKYKDISGIILSGGKSLRMGADLSKSIRINTWLIVIILATDN